MQIIVLANEMLKEELTANGVDKDARVAYTTSFDKFINLKGDVFIDLLFERSHIEELKKLNSEIIINAVIDSSTDLDVDFIRINGWPTFLHSNLTETYAPPGKKEIAEKVLSLFNKTPEWLDDINGFITPRVISCIINEAYFALSEGVSTKEEIDTAMKLGTNYPYGPFEWSQKIGLKNIAALLTKLSIEEERYTPSKLLLEEAAQERTDVSFTV